MNRIRATLAALATVAAALAPSAAHAVDLPPAKSLAECAAPGGNIDNPTYCETGTDLAQVTLAPFAGARAEATYPGSFAFVTAGAFASLSYSWVFEGGTPGELLPVDILVNLSVSSFGSNNASAFAAVTVNTPLQGVVQVCVNTTATCAQGGSGFYGTVRVMTRAGDVNTISLEATVSGAFSADMNGGKAFADPRISLAPEFTSGAAYQLRLSDGVGNEVAPIPEPTSTALMAAGLAGLAGVLGRRRAGRTAFMDQAAA